MPAPCSLEKGTTYNAYLIYGEEYTALVDASHEKFGNLFIATLKEQLAAAGRGIDYVLVSGGAGCAWAVTWGTCKSWWTW
jgi:flavorubredoxin